MGLGGGVEPGFSRTGFVIFKSDLAFMLVDLLFQVAITEITEVSCRIEKCTTGVSIRELQTTI